MSSPRMALAREPDILSWQHAAEWVEAKSGFLAIALCICFAGMSLAIAARRPFWFDEIVTISMAHAPTLKGFLPGFFDGWDQTPPLNGLLVRAFCSAFGWTELVARLPSLMFATAGLLILFHQVRALTKGVFGLTAISVLLVTFLPRWACEARPYALFFFASVLALCFWTSDSARDGSLKPSLYFGLSMTLAVFAQYFAVLLILPFAADELKSRGLRKVLSIRLVCGIAGLSLGLAAHLPFVLAASQRRLIHFWAFPSLHKLQQSYPDILGLLLFLTVCAVMLFAWTGSKSTESVGPQTPQERVGWFFLSLPIAGYILAELFTHAFTMRYFAPLLAGIGLAFGCFLYRHYRNTPQAPLLILLVAVPLFLQTSASEINYARTPVVSGRTPEADVADEMLPRFRAEGKRFILLPEGRSVIEALYYAADPKMIRSPYQPDIFPTIPFASDPLRVRYFSMDEIRKFGRETAFVAPKPELLSSLERWGFHIRWRRTEPEPVVYVE